jgi:hypothetical protein
MGDDRVRCDIARCSRTDPGEEGGEINYKVGRAIGTNEASGTIEK